MFASLRPAPAAGSIPGRTGRPEIDRPAARRRDYPARAVALASALALLVGAIITVAGIAKLGFIADLISKPTIIGYMNGLALTILVGQLPKLFGFSVKGDGFRAELTDGRVLIVAWRMIGGLTQSRHPRVLHCCCSRGRAQSGSGVCVCCNRFRLVLRRVLLLRRPT